MKMLTKVIILGMLMLLATANCFADSKYVELSTDEFHDSSKATTKAKQSTVYKGFNSKSSKYKVYFTSEYKANGNWCKNSERLIAVGGKVSPFNTTKFTSSHSFRLTLNPQGIHKACTAEGHIKTL